jgi:hypothetical protein
MYSGVELGMLKQLLSFYEKPKTNSGSLFASIDTTITLNHS